MTSTKQLLNAGRGHQAPRKAAHSLPKEVEQFIKDNEAKELGTTETHPGEGIVKERFPHSRKPSHRQICEEFWNLRGQHNWEEKKKNKTPQNMHLTTTASIEVAQMLTSATSKWLLDREARAACLG